MKPIMNRRDFNDLMKTNNNKEPSFYKLYKGSELSIKLTYIEMGIISFASCADANDVVGGMTVSLNGIEKDRLSAFCKCSVSRIAHTQTNLVKSGMLRKVGPSIYQVNPYFIGIGKWKDILVARQKWDDGVTFEDQKV